jgi:hypothetical protein
MCFAGDPVERDGAAREEAIEPRFQAVSKPQIGCYPMGVKRSQGRNFAHSHG